MAKYLNGQWWYQFNTGDYPIGGYSRVLDLFDQAVTSTTLKNRTLDYLSDLDCVLPAERAYDPDLSLTFGRMCGSD